jgi:hypothetical protein
MTDSDRKPSASQATPVTPAPDVAPAAQIPEGATGLPPTPKPRTDPTMRNVIEKGEGEPKDTQAL